VARAAGWHGLPPTTHQFIPPLQLPAPSEGITESVPPAPPLWIDLEYANGSRQTVRGFAMAWTASAVLAQWVEFSLAREAWVRPDQCTRREIPRRSDDGN
jgi:ABC-type nitrate/sulfonate/bicarbonate transport system permease component